MISDSAALFQKELLKPHIEKYIFVEVSILLSDE